MYLLLALVCAEATETAAQSRATCLRALCLVGTVARASLPACGCGDAQALVTRKVVEGLVHNIPTKEIDTLIAETGACARAAT